MIRRHQEKAVFALMAVLAAWALASALGGAHPKGRPSAAGPEELRSDASLPAAVTAEPLFVAAAFSEYFPGARPADRPIFGTPPKAAPKFRRAELPVPAPQMPSAPAAATTPGPALQHSQDLPRAGSPPDAWKKP